MYASRNSWRSNGINFYTQMDTDFNVYYKKKEHLSSSSLWHTCAIIIILLYLHTYRMKYVLRVVARDKQRSNNRRFIVLSYRAAKVTFDPIYRSIVLYNIKTIMRVVRRRIFCKFHLWPWTTPLYNVLLYYRCAV